MSSSKSSVFFLLGAAPEMPARLGAKTRYRMPDAACTVEATDGVMRATFDAPQWAPTPGQYLVLYDGDTCLGGAVIVEPSSAAEPAIANCATC